MTCDATMWTQIDVESQKIAYKSTGLKFCRVNVLQELHIVTLVMTLPLEHTCYKTSTILKQKKNALFVAPEFNGLSRA